MRKQVVPIVAGIVLALLNSVPSPAQESARILTRVDSTLTAPKDIVATQRMTLIDSDGHEKVRILKMYQKGSEKRLARFVEPADVRDVGFLRLTEDQMYLYLPAFRRVRRIASSIKNEDFMGTDLSYEDLSRTQYAPDYRVVAETSTEQAHQLTLEPRSDADVSYGRIVMEVQPDTWVITAMELFDRNGQLVKTIEFSAIEETGGYWFPLRVEVTSVRDGHRTVLDFEELQFDTGLSDEFFSQRQLKRTR